MVVPALLGIIWVEWQSSIEIYLAFVGMSSTGYIMNKLGEKSPLNLKQSCIVVVLSSIFVKSIRKLPCISIHFHRELIHFSLFTSSFSESTSGFTTTGISRLENLLDSNR